MKCFDNLYNFKTNTSSYVYEKMSHYQWAATEMRQTCRLAIPVSISVLANQIRRYKILRQLQQSLIEYTM